MYFIELISQLSAWVKMRGCDLNKTSLLYLLFQYKMVPRLPGNIQLHLQSVRAGSLHLRVGLLGECEHHGEAITAHSYHSFSLRYIRTPFVVKSCV